MSNPFLWREWLGYPHRIGSDPRVTNSCCCLKMIQAMYEEMNLGTLPFNDEWYEMYRQKNTEALFKALKANTEELCFPALWSIVCLCSFGRLGLGLVVQNGEFIVPYHYGGVKAYPITSLPPESARYYRPICS